MGELHTKIINGIEYIQVKEYLFNQKKYYLYFDVDKNEKVIICDNNKELVIDPIIITSILRKAFHIDTGIKYAEDENTDSEQESSENDDTDSEEISDEYEILSETEKEIIFARMKELFFYKFGRNVLSEEELDRRIAENIKNIVIVDELEKDNNNIVNGCYIFPLKEIRIIKSNKDTEMFDSIMFHEFIHGIVGEGLTRKITYVFELDNEETYSYGNRIEEGIVSLIQFMYEYDKWEPFSNRGTYDFERNLALQLRALCKNVSGKDLIIQFIKDPQNTLPMINKIFEDRTRALNGQLTERELKLASMRDSFEFLLDFEDMSRENDSSKKLEIFNKLEQELTQIYVLQIKRMPIRTIEELYDLLYEIEGFGLNLGQKSESIEQLKINIIQEFLANNPNIKLYNIKRNLPKNTKTTLISREQRLLIAIFGNNDTADIRYSGIKSSLEKVQELGQVSKDEIGRAFGISVSTDQKEKIELLMSQIQDKSEKGNITHDITGE
jgi:hypothetical protein